MNTLCRSAIPEGYGVASMIQKPRSHGQSLISWFLSLCCFMDLKNFGAVERYLAYKGLVLDDSNEIKMTAGLFSLSTEPPP